MRSLLVILKKSWILSIIAAFFILQLTACAQRAVFPIGLFECVECEGYAQRFSDDGTTAVYRQGEEWFHGKWSVKGNTLYIGDSLCFDAEKMPASYKWSFDGETLTFHLVKDECSGRVNFMDGKPFKLIEE